MSSKSSGCYKGHSGKGLVARVGSPALGPEHQATCPWPNIQRRQEAVWHTEFQFCEGVSLPAWDRCCCSREGQYFSHKSSNVCCWLFGARHLFLLRWCKQNLDAFFIHLNFTSPPCSSKYRKIYTLISWSLTTPLLYPTSHLWPFSMYFCIRKRHEGFGSRTK